ncbi:MAG: APC family permease, partial [Rhodospirillaceae bacterium]
DMVNLAEEVDAPERTLPWAILLTLVLTTAIYFAVTTVAVLSVPLDELGRSRAPLSCIFTTMTGAPAGAITAVAIVATLNGVIIQIVMASRVVYGLAKQGSLPARFAASHPRTRTPQRATGVVDATVLVLALAFPVAALAETTFRAALTVFALVNLSLLQIKRRDGPPPPGQFRTWTWVPGAGLLTCVALLAADLLG